MKKALVIIDMQIMPFIWKDYGGKPIYQENQVVDKAKKLIKKAKDADAPVYYVMYTEPEGSPRAENQPLWQIHPEISPVAQDKVIVKYHADSFYETNLDKLLRDNGIETVVLCGVQTEFCVDTTVKSAYSHGYKVELASDCHSTYDSSLLTAEQIIAHHNTILAQFTRVLSTEEITFMEDESI